MSQSLCVLISLVIIFISYENAYDDDDDDDDDDDNAYDHNYDDDDADADDDRHDDDADVDDDDNAEDCKYSIYVNFSYYFLSSLVINLGVGKTDFSKNRAQFVRRGSFYL